MTVRKFILSLGMLLGTCVAASAQTIGISLPLSGDFAELGAKFRKGVEIAARELNPSIRVIFVDDGCDATMAQDATESLIKENVDIAAGFLCSDAAIVSATRLSESKTPVIVSGARSVRLIKDREREEWNLWRLSPGDDYPVTTAAQAILQQWRDTPFALVDDGTIYGRNFTDQLRFKLDDLGLKPQFSDSFRAAQSTQAGLLRRLERSGVTAVFIASAALEDLQTIAIDNTRLETGLDLIVTEALSALPFIDTAKEVTPGIKMIGWPLNPAPELEAIFEEEKILPDQLIYDGYATLQVAISALGKTPEETTRNLTTTRFDTILGPISFQPGGASTFNPYRLLEWNGEIFSKPKQNTPTQ